MLYNLDLFINNTSHIKEKSLVTNKYKPYFCRLEFDLKQQPIRFKQCLHVNPQKCCGIQVLKCLKNRYTLFRAHA